MANTKVKAEQLEAAQTNITSLGTLTALTVDDITIDGSTISDGGDLTFDVTGNLILDADGGEFKFRDGGTDFARIFQSGGNFYLNVPTQDTDLIIQGNDGGSNVSALTFDMSDAGAATFNADVTAIGIKAIESVNGDPVLGHFYNANSGNAAESTVYITNSSTVSDGLFLQAYGASATTAGGFVQDSATLGSGSGASGGLSIMTRAAADMRFYTNGHTNERMRIDSSGSVGVGTTPNSGWSASTTSGRVPIQIGAGSISGRLNDNYTEFSNNCYASGTGNDPQWAGMSRYAKQQIEFDSNGQIIFKNAAAVDQTTFDSSPNFTFSNRMVIEADGGVAIGGTSSVYTCEIHGTAIIGAQYNKGAVMPFSDNTYDLGHSSYRWDDVYATNSTIQTSDKNLKNNITESDLGLSFIKELKPVSYKWKEGKSDRTHYGLIAQDVETVLSDISKPTSDFAGFIKMEPEEEAPKHEENPVTETRYGLRYNEFIAPLIKAVQELSNQIEENKCQCQTNTNSQ